MWQLSPSLLAINPGFWIISHHSNVKSHTYGRSAECVAQVGSPQHVWKRLPVRLLRSLRNSLESMHEDTRCFDGTDCLKIRCHNSCAGDSVAIQRLWLRSTLSGVRDYRAKTTCIAWKPVYSTFAWHLEDLHKSSQILWNAATRNWPHLQ